MKLNILEGSVSVVAVLLVGGVAEPAVSALVPPPIACALCNDHEIAGLPGIPDHWHHRFNSSETGVSHNCESGDGSCHFTDREEECTIHNMCSEEFADGTFAGQTLRDAYLNAVEDAAERGEFGAIRALLKESNQVEWNEARRSLQLLDCERDHVVASTRLRGVSSGDLH